MERGGGATGVGRKGVGKKKDGSNWRGGEAERWERVTDVGLG